MNIINTHNILILYYIELCKQVVEDPLLWACLGREKAQGKGTIIIINHLLIVDPRAGVHVTHHHKVRVGTTG